MMMEYSNNNKLYTSSPEKLLVRLIDGTLSWVAINVKHIANDDYLILNDEIYQTLDNSVLIEFFSGDIVTGNSGLIADL